MDALRAPPESFFCALALRRTRALVDRDLATFDELHAPAYRLVALKRLVIMLWAALWLSGAGAQEAGPLTNFNVVLLQPSSVLEGRVAKIDAMADYVKAVEAAAREAVVASGARQAVGGFIVVAVRPGLQSKVWLDFDALLGLELRKQLLARVTAVPPFEVTQGPVVFALRVATWDGKASKRFAPSPPEWRKVTGAGDRLEVGELVERIWATE